MLRTAQYMPERRKQRSDGQRPSIGFGGKPSLKDLHRLRLFVFKNWSAYAPSVLGALVDSQPRGKPRG